MPWCNRLLFVLFPTHQSQLILCTNSQFLWIIQTNVAAKCSTKKLMHWALFTWIHCLFCAFQSASIRFFFANYFRKIGQSINVLFQIVLCKKNTRIKIHFFRLKKRLAFLAPTESPNSFLIFHQNNCMAQNICRNTMRMVQSLISDIFFSSQSIRKQCACWQLIKLLRFLQSYKSFIKHCVCHFHANSFS